MAHQALIHFVKVAERHHNTCVRRELANPLEALKGNRKGQHSIRINDQWRVCFAWHDDGAYRVEIVDYH